MSRLKQLLTWVTQAAVAAALIAGSQIGLAQEVGDQAPDFSVPGSDGQTYTLSQFRGEKPVVIAFFPKAFTGG